MKNLKKQVLSIAFIALQLVVFKAIAAGPIKPGRAEIDWTSGLLRCAGTYGFCYQNHVGSTIYIWI